jgi:aspartyl-tRNA(Asn)/glutamyl-tRNA(Gln) amidotransferase subunit B
MKEFETIIGLEIHVELATSTKLFCSCSARFTREPNRNCCPLCMGMPGTLPVLNRKAVEYAVRVGLALSCRIERFSRFDRKNYFYPDLPKGYQITQYEYPLCKEGYFDIDTPQGIKRIGIAEIHLEEDAGKLIHLEDGFSLIDYNRAGIPLIEIVTEPDLRSAEEAKIFSEDLRNLIMYTRASDCKMQEGSMRVDVNLSVREKGTPDFGTRTEIKNLNSFRSVARAIQYESERQIRLLKSGKNVLQETRRWDEVKGESVPMRNKEDISDYRYFKEPDLPAIILSLEEIESVRKTLPSLPRERMERYRREWNLPWNDAKLIASSRALADFYEKTVQYCRLPKEASHWVTGEVLKKLNEKKLVLEESDMDPKFLGKLILLVKEERLTGSVAKKIFDIMFDTKEDPEKIIASYGRITVKDAGQLDQVIEKVLKENPKAVADYLGGKKKTFGYFMGEIMKETNGRADTALAKKILEKRLAFLYNNNNPIKEG